MSDNSNDGRRLHETRRQFLRGSAAALTAVPAFSGVAVAQDESVAGSKRKHPNVIIFHADQFRWDVLGAYGLNPMGLTPNLDGMAKRGTLFQNAITNQPVCAPSRACLLTGQYPYRNGVWMNGLGLTPGVSTIATAFRQAGYSANYIGKWHLAPPPATGPVSPEHRGGFLDLWHASNVLEFTSHPYEGDVYDEEGKPIHFSDTYRVDFLTQQAVSFLRRSHREPFLLVVSNIEPHFQNDMKRCVAPKGYAARYANPFVPHDLRPFPGDWPSQLPDYYGCIAKIDEAVGTLLKTLSELGMEDDTIVAFMSDHGCHFKTRNTEYKRSPHESSVHVPLVIQGPGFNRSRTVPELIGMVDIAPTLLEAAGVSIPETMQGKSAMPLVAGRGEGWRNEVFIQLAEFVVGRALRTERWLYAVGSSRRQTEVAVPFSQRFVEYQTPNLTGGSTPAPYSDRYVEYQFYDLSADPHQLVNLAGRDEYLEIAADLRERLRVRIAEAGDQKAIIEGPLFPYP